VHATAAATCWPESTQLRQQAAAAARCCAHATTAGMPAAQAAAARSGCTASTKSLGRHHSHTHLPTPRVCHNDMQDSLYAAATTDAARASSSQARRLLAAPGDGLSIQRLEWPAQQSKHSRSTIVSNEQEEGAGGQAHRCPRFMLSVSECRGAPLVLRGVPVAGRAAVGARALAPRVAGGLVGPLPAGDVAGLNGNDAQLGIRQLLKAPQADVTVGR
jgi:hypothetical protein